LRDDIGQAKGRVDNPNPVLRQFIRNAAQQRIVFAAFDLGKKPRAAEIRPVQAGSARAKSAEPTSRIRRRPIRRPESSLSRRVAAADPAK